MTVSGGKLMNLLIFYRGESFLHHMVRYLVGTMVNTFHKNSFTKNFKSLLIKPSKSAYVYKAPAQGLFLDSVFMKNKILILIFFISISHSETISETRETAITRAINKVGPAIASINIEQHISSFSFDPFFGIGFPRDIIPMKSSGSGVVISPDGYVMTNQHVIAGADRITVTLTGGNEYEAELVGSDETSDLALLKLRGNNFPYAKLGDSDDLIIGEWIIALGNPFQLFSVSNKPSASVGIVSAMHMDFGHQKNLEEYFKT